MKRCKAVTKWLLRVANWVANPHDQAELLYQALGNGEPYTPRQMEA